MKLDPFNPFALFLAAVGSENMPAVAYFLSRYPIKAKERATALESFSSKRNLEGVEMMVAHDPSIIKVAMLALARAAQQGDEKIVRYLLAQGDDLRRGGDRALKCALAGEHVKLTLWLMKRYDFDELKSLNGLNVERNPATAIVRYYGKKHDSKHALTVVSK